MSFVNKIREILTGGKWWSALIFASVPLLMILVIVSEWEALTAFEWQLDWGFLALMVLLHSLAQASLLGAWHYALRQLTNRSHWWQDFRIFNLSILARRIPLPIWYIGSRLHLYRQAKVPVSAVVTATGLEIILITISGLICFILLLPFYTFTQNWPWQIIVLAASVFALILLARPGLLVDAVNFGLRKLKRPEIPAAITRIDLLVCTAFYLGTWFLDGLGLYALVAALVPQPPPLPSVIGVSTVTALVAVLSMAIPGGFGLKEITMSALLSIWMPLPSAIAISIAYRLAQTIVEAFWALGSQQADKYIPKKGD